MSEFILYNYYRSSSSFRVRIAFHLKSINYQYVPVHLLKEGGEQNKESFRALNPKGEVPLLVHNQFILAQSMAIIQYLDDIRPEVPLFPSDIKARALVLQFCEIINSGIQPLQNLNVINEIKRNFNASETHVNQWTQHWIHLGFKSLEAILSKTAGTYCFGGQITAADLFLIPQVVSALRFGVNLKPFPIIQRIYDASLKVEAFQLAHPERQIDAPRIQ